MAAKKSASKGAASKTAKDKKPPKEKKERAPAKYTAKVLLHVAPEMMDKIRKAVKDGKVGNIRGFMREQIEKAVEKL